MPYKDKGNQHNGHFFPNGVQTNQINCSVTFPKDIWDKWFCMTWLAGQDKDPIHRYLQPDGTWGQNTHYFDNEEEIDALLPRCASPTFYLSEMDLQHRAMIREDVERGMDDCLDFDDGFPGEHDFF